MTTPIISQSDSENNPAYLFVSLEDDYTEVITDPQVIFYLRKYGRPDSFELRPIPQPAAAPQPVADRPSLTDFYHMGLGIAVGGESLVKSLATDDYRALAPTDAERAEMQRGYDSYTPPQPAAPDWLDDLASKDAALNAELASMGLRRASELDGEPGWLVTTSAGKVWATYALASEKPAEPPARHYDPAQTPADDLARRIAMHKRALGGER